MKKYKSVFSWILRVLIFLGFLLASVGKLTNNPQVIEMFENWGYPNGFYFLIGILELILAVLLLIPKTLKIAIFGILIILIGAMATHIINDPLLELIRPIIFLVLLGGIYIINYYKKT
ncbi:MAG: DoxX family membrane protein [Maribacter sp.]|nr:DoxX family membrane protein [Maribacter sp.]